MNSQKLRKAFFDFFSEKGHEIVKSAPIIIKNDPTLMFTNAGMNQFKDIFLGTESARTKRVTNTQKCLRVSGKHNDLEEVGRDSYHHTMFEMLGNWSFGDYFKKEAIEMAWEFLTSVLEIPEDRIYTTIFEGSKEANLERDNEAAGYWESCFSDTSNKILNGSKKDNFWEMGETGPCGPCSEIHIDIRSDEDRKEKPGHQLVNKDHPLVIELWNLVFIQYNRKSDGSLEALPLKHVDTGMGFERLCMLMQGKKSNYDTDIFQSLISEISSIAGISYGKSEDSDIAMRVVADHLRAVSFSIADGQLPSNNKAGYVIRRILRRAIRYAYKYLGIEEPFIYRLLPVLVNIMGDTFPELKSQQDQIFKVIHQEETAFLNTLGKGMKLIDKKINDLKNKAITILPGKDAFTLYDTYGFPIDLTELILKEESMSVNTEEFNTEMSKQKQRSRVDAVKETDDWVILSDSKGTEFTGYSNSTDKIKITRYRKIRLKDKEQYHLVFDKTPFYAESGGQLGDKGYITSGDEKIEILDTIKETNLTIHIAKSIPEFPHDYFEAILDTKNRDLTSNNHTATHLLHFALREVLGKHVEQQGSIVTADKLRFDFSHFEKISKIDILKIEKIVNKLIRSNLSRHVLENITMQEALNEGAIALFGEKYGDKVRLVRFGESVELCGGTHVESTGNIGFFKIISESAIAAGIRRIEAISSEKAYEFINHQLMMIDKLNDMLTGSKHLPDTVGKLLQQLNDHTKKIERLEANASAIIRNELIEKAEFIDGVTFISDQVNIESMNIMKQIANMVRTSSERLILATGARIDNKANLLLMISEDLVKEKNLHAGNILREVSHLIKGGGGGQAFLATAGGSYPDGIPEALNKIRSIVHKALN